MVATMIAAPAFNTQQTQSVSTLEKGSWTSLPRANKRWSTAGCLIAFSVAIIAADMLVLGDSNWVVDAFNFITGSNYKAELTALVSMTILCLTKSLTALPCQNDFSKRRKVVE